MTGFEKIFIDTAPFIYYIEKNEEDTRYFDKMERFFIDGYQNDVAMVTSVITIEEYCVFPYRNGLDGHILAFTRLIDALGIEIVEIDRAIAKKAAKIRAEYRHFKAMDALQLAVACIKGCTIFLTNDRQLKQFKEIRCITVDDL